MQILKLFAQPKSYPFRFLYHITVQYTPHSLTTNRYLLTGPMYTLTANSNWPTAKYLPEVQVSCHLKHILSFEFDVSESPECFRNECKADGAPCWQDSCVEVFINSPSRGVYYNFECSCSGFCLAEYGTQRNGRVKFEDYRDIRRTWIRPPVFDSGKYRWRIRLEIPRILIGLDPDESVFGNLYKCASAAQCPHYLSAFKVDSENPDFHRPEFFRSILSD